MKGQIVMISTLLQANKSRLASVSQYLMSQGVTVASNLLYGLLCVRLIKPEEYAKFVVVFAVQGTFVILMDVGITGSLIPLVGSRTGDYRLIADFVASIRYLARRLYLALAVCLAIGYPILVRNRHWSSLVVVSMVMILLLSTWFMRISASYGAVLILLQNRASWYRGQMISAVGTLAMLLFCWAVGTLGGFQAILINVLGIVFTGFYYYFASKRLLGLIGVVSKAKVKAALRFTLPNIPGIVFYALQGQIALFLITLFGRNTGVASVGALSRLGQIFVLLGQMNMLLIEPFFARLPSEKVWRNYMVVTGTASLLAGFIVAAACLFPELFLVVLGPSYSRLTTEVKLVVASSAVSYVTNVLWSIHSARRFIYWWSNITNIILAIAVQLLFISKADLTSVRSVVWLNSATVFTAFLTSALSGIYGFITGPRAVESDTPAPRATTSTENLILDRNIA